MSGLKNKKWEGILDGYRVWMFGIADEMRGRGGVAPERVDEVIRAKGKLPIAEYLRCRVRYFVDGVAIGSRGFVEGLQRARALAKRSRTLHAQEGDAGPGKRKRRGTAARLLEGLDSNALELPLFSLRGLRKKPISGSQIAA